MRHEIVVEDKYISASYWGNGDAGSRIIHTNKLVSVSDTLHIYKFLIDTLDLDSQMEPLDFFIFATYIQENYLTDKVKIAIVCHESSQRSLYSKFNLNDMGILTKVFNSKDLAIKWLN